jgi:hypothetical protein
MSDKPEKFSEWAKVELMGHNVIIGQVSEASLAGGAFLRVDVPSFNGSPAFTRYFSPNAIYGISPVTEEVARALLTHYRHEPVSRFEMPQLAEKSTEADYALPHRPI